MSIIHNYFNELIKQFYISLKIQNPQDLCQEHIQLPSVGDSGNHRQRVHGLGETRPASYQHQR